MVFKRIDAASKRTRYVNGPHQVVLIRASAKFEKKLLIERPDEAEAKSLRDQSIYSDHNY